MDRAFVSNKNAFRARPNPPKRFMDSIVIQFMKKKNNKMQKCNGNTVRRCSSRCCCACVCTFLARKCCVCVRVAHSSEFVEPRQSACLRATVRRATDGCDGRTLRMSERDVDFVLGGRGWGGGGGRLFQSYWNMCGVE